MFDDFFFKLVVLSVLAVLVVLMIGIGGFGKGGAFNRQNGNKLMRLRIAAQFVAVCMILAYVYVRNQTGQ